MRPPPQIITAARLLLGISQAEIAKEFKIGIRSLHGAEHALASLETVEKIVKLYKGKGIIFIEPRNGEGWGLICRSLTERFDDAKERALLDRPKIRKRKSRLHPDN